MSLMTCQDRFALDMLLDECGGIVMGETCCSVMPNSQMLLSAELWMAFVLSVKT